MEGGFAICPRKEQEEKAGLEADSEAPQVSCSPHLAAVSPALFPELCQ